MSIISGNKVFIPYINTTNGYIECKLSSSAVRMNDGYNLQTTIDEIKNNNLLNLLNMYAWDKYDGSDVSTIPEIEETSLGETVIAEKTDLINGKMYIAYGDKVDVRQGKMVHINFIDKILLSSSNLDERMELIKGKYIYTEYDKKFYRIPSTATLKNTSTGTFSYEITVSECYRIDWTNESDITYSKTIYSSDPFYEDKGDARFDYTHYFIGKLLDI